VKIFLSIILLEMIVWAISWVLLDIKQLREWKIIQKMVIFISNS